MNPLFTKKFASREELLESLRKDRNLAGADLRSAIGVNLS